MGERDVGVGRSHLCCSIEGRILFDETVLEIMDYTIFQAIHFWIYKPTERRLSANLSQGRCRYRRSLYSPVVILKLNSVRWVRLEGGGTQKIDSRRGKTGGNNIVSSRSDGLNYSNRTLNCATQRLAFFLEFVLWPKVSHCLKAGMRWWQGWVRAEFKWPYIKKILLKKG